MRSPINVLFAMSFKWPAICFGDGLKVESVAKYSTKCASRHAPKLVSLPGVDGAICGLTRCANDLPSNAAKPDASVTLDAFASATNVGARSGIDDTNSISPVQAVQPIKQ